VRLIDDGALRERLAAEAQAASRAYDIAAFVRKMERLYGILVRDSRATRRQVASTADLSFLDGRGVA
jgi:hypothetical protein